MTHLFEIKGISSYLETYYEFVAHIQSTVDQKGSKANIAQIIGGRGKLYELAEHATNLFEDKYKYKDDGWDGNFFDAIDKFIKEEYNSINIDEL